MNEQLVKEEVHEVTKTIVSSETEDEEMEIDITFVGMLRKPEKIRMRMKKNDSLRYIKSQCATWFRRSENSSKSFFYSYEHMMIGDVYYNTIYEFFFSGNEINIATEEENIFCFDTRPSSSVSSSPENSPFGYDIISNSELFDHMEKRGKIILLPFCEYRFFTFHGYNRRKRLFDYPILGTCFFNQVTGKEIYETCLSLLRFYMVDNAREILLERTEGKMDLDDPTTLFRRPEEGDEMKSFLKSERKKDIYYTTVHVNSWEESHNIFGNQEHSISDRYSGGNRKPLFIVQCYCEEDTLNTISRYDRKELLYTPRQKLQLQKFGSFKQGRNRYKHHKDDIKKGEKTYLHVRFNVRCLSSLVEGLFDTEGKLGDNQIINNSHRWVIDIQSSMFDPEVMSRVDDLWSYLDDDEYIGYFEEVDLVSMKVERFMTRSIGFKIFKWMLKF